MVEEPELKLTRVLTEKITAEPAGKGRLADRYTVPIELSRTLTGYEANALQQAWEELHDPPSTYKNPVMFSVSRWSVPSVALQNTTVEEVRDVYAPILTKLVASAVRAAAIAESEAELRRAREAEEKQAREARIRDIAAQITFE